MKTTEVSRRTIRRLPGYLRFFYEAKELSLSVVSSTKLSEHTGLIPVVIKKDLASIDVPAKLGVGYEVDAAICAIEKFLGWNNPTKAFLVGVGSLGKALLRYEGLKKHSLEIVSAFDIDSNKIGKEVAGVSILPINLLPELIKSTNIKLAILAVPKEVSQEITDIMVEAGILAIWNFSPTRLNVSDHVSVRQEDLSSGFAELSAQVRQYGK